MDADGPVLPHADDHPEQTPFDLIALGRLVAEGATVMAKAVSHVREAPQSAVTSGADEEDALVREAASLEGAGYEDHRSLRA
jgi:hypothetical protein